MSFSKESAVQKAKIDLARRLGVTGPQIQVVSSRDKDFPNASLGAPVNSEMSLQMIVSGWQIVLSANGKNYEYRADRQQIRAVNFNGTNDLVRI
jgi:hypothetical protein